MSGRHLADRSLVIALIAGTPDAVAQNLGAVVVCQLAAESPDPRRLEGEFFVELNGGDLPEGEHRVHFHWPLDAFNYASRIARSHFSQWSRDTATEAGTTGHPHRRQGGE